MLGVSGPSDSKGDVRNLLELRIESSVGKRHSNLGRREEALTGAEGGGEVGISGYEHECVTGADMEELDGLHS